MRYEWPETELSNIAKLRSGFPFKSSNWRSDGVPVIKIANVKSGRIQLDGCGFVSMEVASSLPEWWTKDGDVLIAMTGYVGEVALLRPGERYLINQRVGRFEFLEGSPVCSTFLFYYLQVPEIRAAIEEMARGSAQPNLSATDASRMKIPVPPKEVQGAVAEIGRMLDDRIDNLRKTNVTLEAIAQALFKSWFVDFDPVHAKAEGREPEAMDAATAALFPSEFEESELGPIPKGWRVGTLADLADLNASKWTARKHPETVKYMDLSGVTSNRIDSATQYQFDEAPSRARHHLREGDTIVGTVRPGNRAFAYIHSPERNLTGSTGFAVLSPKLACYASYVYLAATGDDTIERLANLADGGAYPAVRPDVVAGTPCVIGGDGVIRAFSEVTQPMLDRIAEGRRTMATLAGLRNTLLPRLISGKLRLPEACQHVEIEA